MMKFDDFMNILEHDVAAFEEYWRKQHIASPETFLMDLGDLEDWYEQFESFTTGID